MIAVIAPEPAAWLRPMLESLADHEVRVFAPWCLPSLPLMPAGWQRRTLPSTVAVTSVPGWQLVEQATREGVLRRLQRRLWCGRLAARWLPRETTAVVAPSLAGLESFAKVEQSRLVEDLPRLRQLHDDLDAVARRHPHARFARNARAPHQWLVRQEQERAMASSVVGRAPLEGPGPTRRTKRDGALHVQLAGLCTTRHGSWEALELVHRLPQLHLHVRIGEGFEPGSLRHHPRVHDGAVAMHQLDAVIAPAWVECRPPEVEAALRAGVPVVASRKVIGPSGFAPGDVEAMVRQLSS